MGIGNEKLSGAKSVFGDLRESAARRVRDPSKQLTTSRSRSLYLSNEHHDNITSTYAISRINFYAFFNTPDHTHSLGLPLSTMAAGMFKDSSLMTRSRWLLVD